MAKLEKGKKMPAFSGKDQNGQLISLQDYTGKKLILFVYPADDTPTCTVEVCNLRDNYKLLQKQGFHILGLSLDDANSHQNFINKYRLPFPLLEDPKLKLIKKFDLWKEKNLYGNKFMGTLRTTIVIDEKGIIVEIFRKVISKDHTNQILKKLGH